MIIFLTVRTHEFFSVKHIIEYILYIRQPIIINIFFFSLKIHFLVIVRNFVVFFFLLFTNNDPILYRSAVPKPFSANVSVNSGY